MAEQLTLFDDIARICCTECGADLRDVNEFRRPPCQVTHGNHVVIRHLYYVLVKRTKDPAATVEQGAA